MSDTMTLNIEMRDKAGKGSARAARREGRVPAVIYGGKQAPDMITIAQNELVRILNRGGFMTHRFEVTIDGKKQQILPRDLQLHPVTDVPMHIDFLRITRDTRVNVEIPVHFVGEDDSPGLGRGGVLNAVRHSIEVSAPATDIPEYFEISLAGLEIGDSVHQSAIQLAEGVKFVIDDRDPTIATIVAPSAVRSDEEREADEAAEAEALEAAEAEAAEAGEGEGDDADGDGGGDADKE